MTAVHVAGPYFLAVKFIPLFMKAEDPSVVNITSMAAHFLNRAVCEFSYGQSKAAGRSRTETFKLMAEEHLTKLMSAGLMPFKIRVNAVVPGEHRERR
jgi:NAD(P)-dependent dehydrogenase (short-subunit alcohol dehydrogenase family)